MKLIFKQLGGFNSFSSEKVYEWQEAETKFEVLEEDIYILKIVANANKQTGKIDDDLRVILDGYSFGKYFTNFKNITWRGFNTGSSWNGTKLRGGVKTIYFFIKLNIGIHKIQFFADGSPKIESIELFKYDTAKSVRIENYREFTAFVFLGVKPSFIKIQNQDEVNPKVHINEKFVEVKNSKLDFRNQNFDFIENILEIDCSESCQVELKLEENIDNLFVLGKFASMYKFVLSKLFKNLDCHYSNLLFRHAFEDYPDKFVFSNRSGIVRLIKKDPVYFEITNKIKELILSGILTGEVYPNVNFETKDLKLSIHGVSKVEFSAIPSDKDKYLVNMSIFHIYDFDPSEYKISGIWLGVYFADQLENRGIINSYEIEININQIIDI